MKVETRKMKKVTLIMVPYPALGHVTPMFHLASSFLQLPDCNYTFAPVLLLPHFLHRQISATATNDVDPRISLVPVPEEDDGEDEPPPSPADFFAIDKAMEQSSSPAGQMEAVVRDIVACSGDGGCDVCMVVDLLVSSAIGVGRRCGLPVAGFWAVDLLAHQLIAAIPQLVATGLVHPHSGIPQYPGIPIVDVLPHDQPALSTDDLPWLIGSPSARSARFKFWNKTLQRSTTQLQYLLVNSFPDQNVLHHQQKQQQPKILQVGPLMPKHQVHTSNNVTFWEQDPACLHWLDTQKPNSVLYIAFGSWVSPIGEPKVQALATTLEALHVPFVWVLGPAWRQGLPCGYEKRLSASQRGMVVSWAPQMKVLGHVAVGCFLTHCGWNSMVEAVRCRKPMLCYPIAGDQFANCARIVEEWRVGVRLSGFGRVDLEEGMKSVLGDGEMSGKLERLCEVSLGDEARVRASDNLSAFVDLVFN
ncbi:unnamed protein product [Linum tenue]|uniref:Glycosyltransferase n=1 Tax=Linum tenue TaxID=586396 RepID=A0AAV0IXW7_9ROSI|nr:unnamed protein product [Linum tenue]